MDLPKLAPGLQWLPDLSDYNGSGVKSDEKYELVARQPGLYRIDAEANAPFAFIGNSSRSSIGIVIEGDGDLELDISEASDKEESDEDRAPEDENTWIPYQELRGASWQQSTEAGIPESIRNSRYTAPSMVSTNDLDFSYSSPQDIFRHMIQSTQEFHSDIYGKILQRIDETGFDCIKALRPAAYEVLFSGNYSRENLLTIGGDTPTAGIYLHIIWMAADPATHFLYVGQSKEMEIRLRNHRDPVYRAKNPCLHYYIWDRGLYDNACLMEESFVFLIEDQGIDPLLLNLFEMWCCLMLQTLSKNALLKYLPADLVAPSAGTHLNIGIPLLQAPYTVMLDCRDPSLYHTSDATIKQYYTSLRRRFYELKFSPSPALREYYLDVIRQRVITRVQTNQRNLTKILDGVEKQAKVSSNSKSGHQWIHLGHFNITISRKWVRLEHNAPVQIRFDLMTKEDFEKRGSNATVYCSRALHSDPAARLSIFVEGTSIEGQPFAGWLRSTGRLTVFKTNTLVDMLENGTMTQSRHLPRRWVRLRLQNQEGQLRRESYYTADK